MEFSSERFEIKIAMLFLRNYFSLETWEEDVYRCESQHCTLYEPSSTNDFQRKIDASGSKMEFLSERFEIETTMFSLKPFLSENVEKEGYYLNPSILEYR